MFEPVIGLEIHCEMKTRTKMFCGCLNDPDEKHPNVNICPICMGHPGTLPVINKKALESVVKVGLALNSKIAEEAKFDRKNYFYPDLPKGYQISQYDKPLCLGGELDTGGKKAAITRVHLEEDTGRLLHIQGGSSVSSGQLASLIDFNRAGIPLMELVTEPDIRSSEEAKKFCEELRLVLRYLGVSEANMEKGEMRCEANISLRKKGASEFGTKVEVKNLNSFRAVERAIEYEIERQAKLLEKEEKVIQETRGWDENGQKTFSQRSKEGAHDYRYFPEPDLPPLQLAQGEPLQLAQGEPLKGDFVDFEKIKAEIGELPNQKRVRFQKEYGLAEKDVEILVFNPDLADYYERVVSELSEWLSSEKMSVPTVVNDKKIIPLTAITLNEGDAIRGPDGKIYVINKNTHDSYLGWKRYIINLDILNMYNHLSLDKIKDVDQITIDAYQTSNLCRVEGRDEIYYLEESGTGAIKHWITTWADFTGLGYVMNQVFIINDTEIAYIGYTTGSNLVYFVPIMANAQLAANYLLTDLQKLLKETAGSASELLISPENFAEMITLIAEGKISSAGAKIVLEEMFRTGADPSMIIEEKNLAQVSGEDELKKFAAEAIAANQKAADDYKAGQNNALQFLVGQVMAKTKGRANPQVVAGILKELLTSD